MSQQNYGNRGDLKISGSGSAGGGSYDNIKISGSGAVRGDVECILLSISGAGKIEGSVKAEEIKVSGSGKIEGNTFATSISVSGGTKFLQEVECESFKTSGSCKIEGRLKAEQVSISGELGVSKRLEAESIKLSGMLKAKGLEAEEFKGSGIFKIEELFTADDIDIELRGKCEAKEMGGETISVKRGNGSRGLFQSFFNLGFGEEVLEVEVIEGDEIYLENTKAKIVRGERINIGPGCQIEQVEYTEAIKVSNDSKVISSIKLQQ